VAGDWDEDTPESATEHLVPYFSDRSDKAPTQVSKEMLCEKLHWDVFTGDFAAIKRAIDESGCDPLRLQEDDETYLHVTANIIEGEVSEEQVVEIAGYFLDKGVDIDKLANTRGTALTRSIEEHHFELARMPVEQGADVNLHNDSRNSPLHLALISGQLELVTLLLQHGADVNARGRWARTPLHHVPTYEIQFAELLLTQGADVNLTDQEGDSPVHNLLNQMERDDQLMDYLQAYVESGADLNKTNGKGQTPLEIVASYQSDRPHHDALRQFLIEKTQ
jgi:ankyrin repeat protein